MDLLKDILQTSGLKKRILHKQAITSPWAMKFPCPMSMGFHVVTQGQAYLWREGAKTPERLTHGDIAFMARGTHHHISTHQDPELLEHAEEALEVQPKRALHNNEPPLLTLISGAYQLWHNPLHPIFHELPEWLILRSENISYADSLQHCLQILSLELTQTKIGSEAITESILDVLFHLILRRILYDNEHTFSQWGQASRDPYLEQALELMHQKPAQEWSVQNLAQAVGLSRSGFALKFKKTMGDTPLHYLTTLRMGKAMDLLANTDQTLENIAHQVGYKEAFGFSKSFKKKVGLSPRDFRQKNDQEREFSWRFS